MGHYFKPLHQRSVAMHQAVDVVVNMDAQMKAPLKVVTICGLASHALMQIVLIVHSSMLNVRER